MTITLAIVADTHINSTLGVCPPVINLDDGGTYISSKVQRELWRAWLDYWEQIDKLPGDKIAVFNGDLGELDTKRRSYQIITPNKATIQSIILDTLAPALDICRGAIFIRGTLAHTGKSSWLEEATAQDVDITIPANGTSSHYQYRGVVEGVPVDIAHHATAGRLPQTEKNAANKTAYIIMYRYMVEMKEKPPKFAYRSHNHRYSTSGDNFDVCAIHTMCFQAKTEFVHRIGQENSLPNIGGHALVCENGEGTNHNFKYKLRGGRLWNSISLPKKS
jgi:hypothetical protein